jgi:flagellar motor protein MotB
MMNTGVLSGITTAADGAMQYKSWTGRKDPNGHYGYWIDRQSGFDKFVYVWVFPETFEVLKYESNRQGDWVVRNNTVAFYGHKVNDLAFTLTYRPRAALTYEALRATVDQASVSVKQVSEGVRVTIAATVLFPSGGAELSTQGQATLATIAETLRKRRGITVAVEGHTDDAMIAVTLAKVFPTNWELSAARAITVLRFLASKGIPESALQARALGATRPTAPNTEKDRHRNRRIELLVIDESERKIGNGDSQ